MKTLAIALSAATLFASAQVSAQQPGDVPRIHVSAASTGNLFASGELYSGTHFETESSKTRDQVRGELRIAQERGELVAGEQYPFVAEAAPGQGKTRAEVQAELAAFRLANPEPYYN
ncbi:DUF4148 domain-containing protein [Pseudoduganella albidiflava]|uniref:DUF4148 domain-containing protein n=1 Tax=Pseudoduganella albidiflava TaxID=321983 RepID=A0A411X5M9_9BURK|nr:DUF4148 domain-containing protein [Pseudoduganella albidiflava]QBI04307.1 DUF4148 domain-containing protein [Pseudoduganella albidiflava]GGY26202.1 hypothetical protein GCM10007387_05150 [Pseudoduganella albidiflava]